MNDLALATFAFNLGLRTLPVSVYAAATSARVHPLLRVTLALIAAAALAAALTGSSDPHALRLALASASVYFLAASCATYGLWRAGARDALGAPLLLATCLTLFLVIPALVLRGPVLVPVVVLGFDRALAAYSYLASAGATCEPRSLRECLFFMLVDPSVAYPRRARPSALPGRARSGWLRALLGAGTLALTELIVRLVQARSPASPALPPLAGYTQLIATVFPLLLVQYLSVSGTASWQIGLLRVLGLRLEERFDYPLLASSPADFWRRWNRYVNDWLRLHVFAAASERAMRGRLRLRAGSAWLVAALATFLLSGALHTLSVFVLYRRWDGRPLIAFAAFGLLVALTPLCSARALALRARLAGRPRLALRALGTIATAHVVLVFGWYLLPALGGL